MELRDILTSIHPLPRSSSEKLMKKAESMTLDRHAVIIDPGKVDNHLYFIKEGLARAYVNADGREITFWLGAEGAAIMSMEGYVNNLPGYETIETIEPTTLFRIHSPALQELYQNDIYLANWGRKLAEKEILRAERCLIPQLYTTATSRYMRFMREYPDLLNRVPLEYLASYLGVTPVSLSHIRSSIRRDHTAPDTPLNLHRKN